MPSCHDLPDRIWLIENSITGEVWGADGRIGVDGVDDPDNKVLVFTSLEAAEEEFEAEYLAARLGAEIIQMANQEMTNDEEEESEHDS